MYKVAVLGDRDSRYGFSTLGFDIVSVTDEESSAKELRRLVKSNYAIIFITENFAELLKDKISVYQNEEAVSIVPIPGVNGNTGIGMKNLKNCVEKAVGSDIISG